MMTGMHKPVEPCSLEDRTGAQRVEAARLDGDSLECWHSHSAQQASGAYHTSIATLTRILFLHSLQTLVQMHS